jgi:hypothetical protein
VRENDLLKKERRRVIGKSLNNHKGYWSFMGLIRVCVCRSQWPRGVGRRSTAARLLRSWVRILPAAWLFVCCECCVLSGRGFCDGLITRRTDFGVSCVIKKPRGRGGHSPRWAAEPEKKKSGTSNKESYAWCPVKPTVHTNSASFKV